MGWCGRLICILTEKRNWSGPEILKSEMHRKPLANLPQLDHGIAQSERVDFICYRVAQICPTLW